MLDYEGGRDEHRIEMMFWECKHGYSDVAENKILCKEIEELKQLLRPQSRVSGQIIICVVSLTYPTEQHSNNS